MENTAGNTSSNLATANVHVLFRRLFAGLLDLVFITFASALVGATIGAFAGPDPGESATVDAVVNAIAILAAIVLIFVVFGLMQSRTGQTLGKKLFKIEVVWEEDGKPPSLGRALLRTLLLLVDGMFFGLVALLAVLMSDKNRRLGDMAARTLVVRSPQGKAPSFIGASSTVVPDRNPSSRGSGSTSNSTHPSISESETQQAAAPTAQAKDTSSGPVSTGEQDPYGKLRRLAELRDQGILTPQEFEEKKQELLSHL